MRSRVDRTALRSAMIMLTLITLSLVAVETVSFLLLRIKGAMNQRRTDARRALSPYSEASWADRYWREFVGSDRVEYHPYVVWRRRPYVGQTINVDASGLRRTLNVQCTDPGFVIWMFGGSTLWGSGAPDEATIPSLLAAEYARDRQSVCIRNYGEMAWVSTQEVIKLLLELKREPRAPDIVIFYDGANEALLPYQSDWLDGHQNLDRIRAVLERPLAERDGSFGWLLESNTARMLQRAASWIGVANRDAALAARYRAHRAVIEDLTRESIRSYFRNIDTVRMLSSGYGFSLFFFWQPVLWTEAKPLTPEEADILESERRALPGLDEVYRHAHRLVAEKGHPGVSDISDSFRDQRSTIYIDPLHVSPEGNRIVAKRIYDELRRRRNR